MSRSDLIVLGGGWGGYTAALTAAQGGKNVTLVEGDRVGGVCLHRGCIPTKALLETAARFRLARESAVLGVQGSDVALDWPAAIAHRDTVVETLHAGMRDALRLAGVRVLEGWGSLCADGSVRVAEASGGESILEGESLIVATGSEPRALSFLPVDGKRVITSDQAIDREPPPRAIVVGGGAVGLEFASMWASLGSEVTLLEALPRILPQEDAQAAGALADALAEDGVRIISGAAIDPNSVRVSQRSVTLAYESDGASGEAKADLVLVAVGRSPRLPDGLAEAGVALADGAPVVDENLQTSVPGIYAVGDLSGGLQLAHVAAAQGRFVAQRLNGADPPTVDPQRMPRAVYTRPQLAAVGLSEADARDGGHAVQVGRAPFSRNGRAMIADEARGLVKIVADEQSGDVLGVHIVGAEASELIGQAALAAFLDASVWELATSVQPHPTLSEGLAEAAWAIVRRGAGKERPNGDA